MPIAILSDMWYGSPAMAGVIETRPRHAAVAANK